MDASSEQPGAAADPAGWLLIGGRDQLDVPAMLTRHGSLYRWPVADGDAGMARSMVPGQPCFLYLVDRSRTMGLWAVGSVVAPALELDAGTPLLPGEAALEPTPDPSRARRWAEVELLALDKPIPRETLGGHQVLTRGGRFHEPTTAGVVALRSDEVHALESFDFWLVDPDEHQRATLDALLAAEDDLLD